MKRLFSTVSIAAIFVLASCAGGQTQTTNPVLSPTEFAEKIVAHPEAPILDVRTPEEFSVGHLEKALNFNWNGDNFQSQISALDMGKPVFVYCRSGSRSATAAKSMRSQGFQEVYELQGGIMRWRDMSLPETK